MLKARRRWSFISRRDFSPPRGVSRRACDRYPGRAANCSATGQATRRPCLALHRMGFIVPRRSPAGRWALTPPFHPCRETHVSAARRFILCDTFHRPELSPRPSAAFPRHAALWCSDFPLPPRRERPSTRIEYSGCSLPAQVEKAMGPIGRIRRMGRPETSAPPAASCFLRPPL